MKSRRENNALSQICAFCDHHAFYVLTYALSNNIKQTESNPNVAIAGEWFILRKPFFRQIDFPFLMNILQKHDAV